MHALNGENLFYNKRLDRRAHHQKRVKTPGIELNVKKSPPLGLAQADWGSAF